ncbi:unnamed protein product, partial [Schistosoma mattheei]
SPCPPASASAHALFREFSYIAPGFFAEHNDNHNTTTTNNCNNHVNLNKEVLNGTNITCSSSPKENFSYSSRHDDDRANPVHVPEDLPPLTPTILKLVSTRKDFQTFVRCFILFDNPIAGFTSHNEFAFSFLKDDHKLL